MSEKLLPCPFCGGSVRMECDDYINGKMVERPEWFIECNTQRCILPHVIEDSADALAAAWNRRP